MTSASYTPENEAEQVMWDFIVSKTSVTHADIKGAVDVTDYKRTNFVAKLKRLGVLQKCGKLGIHDLFTVHDTEALRKNDTEKRQSAHGGMWASMRVLKNFTPIEVRMAILQRHPDITEKAVTTYCQKLLKAQYLRVVQTAKIGVRPAHYKLINDTGPLPPQVKHKQVIIDGNDGTVVHVEGAQL
ncbi:hypothetical protein [Celeribacter baekdonensis]|uniref:hypothetical protein n=1 Tax=Celeribacter baekdonensis TaxID=875171 RepID=UPI0030DA0453|tara:strand:- start:28207 stop:28761 length:555 start_codon:yes stop_codon:yes gene_type:complete